MIESKLRRWSDSPRFALSIFLLALLTLTAANWGFRWYQERREAERLAQMTQHYEQELRKQMDAVRKPSDKAPPAPN